MLFYTGLTLLIIGVSLDSFGVGITYGMRRIRVPIIALLIIMLCSGSIVLLSMTIGNVLRSFVTPDFAELLGGIILFIIGVFCLLNVVRSQMDSDDNRTALRIPEDERWNQVKTVFKSPQKADIDHSGTISIKEAIILGFALALDAFGAGLGAAMLGYLPLVTAILMALTSGLFVFCGIRLGIFLSSKKWTQQMVLLPPFLLITLGIYNMM